MTIEIASCQDCPLCHEVSSGIYSKIVCGHPYADTFICDRFKVPNPCPLRQDNTITFKLKEDENLQKNSDSKS